MFLAGFVRCCFCCLFGLAAFLLLHVLLLLFSFAFACFCYLLLLFCFGSFCCFFVFGCRFAFSACFLLLLVVLLPFCACILLFSLLAFAAVVDLLCFCCSFCFWCLPGFLRCCFNLARLFIVVLWLLCCSWTLKYSTVYMWCLQESKGADLFWATRGKNDPAETCNEVAWHESAPQERPARIHEGPTR